MASLIRRMGIQRVLVRDTAVLYLANFGAGAIQFGTLILLARLLGPADLGAVVVASKLAGLIAALIELGIGPVLVRYRAALPKEDPEAWLAMSRFLIRVAVALSMLVAVVGAVAVAVLWLVDLPATTLMTVGFGCATGALFVLLTYCQNVFQADRRFGTVAALVTMVSILRLAAVASLAALGALTLVGALGIYVASVAAVVVLGLCLLPRPIVAPRQDEAATKRGRSLAMAFMRWVAVGRTISALNGRLDILLLSVLAGSSATGFYGAAFQSAAPLNMLGTAISEVSFPHLVRDDRTKRLKAILKRWSLWLPVFIAVGLAAAAVGWLLLPAIFGSSFEESVLPFQLLVVSFSLQAWLQPAGAMLLAIDRQHAIAWINAGQLALLVVLNLALIPALGVVGPAVAVAVSSVIAVPLVVGILLRYSEAAAR